MNSTIIGLVLAATCFSACRQPDPAPAPQETLISLNTEMISVQHEAADVNVKVTADGDWGVTSKDKSWVNVTPGGGIAGTSDITVRIYENKTGDVRETELVFSTKSGKKSLPVRQNYKIDAVTVSDPAFMSYLIKTYDDDGDGILSTKEASAITEIKAADCGIKAMPELNTVFKNITYLDCSGNALTELALSGMTKLKYLDCSDNKLIELDLSQLVGLQTMNAEGNPLVTIYVWTGFEEPDGFSKPASASYVEPEINTPAGYNLVWQEEFNESATGLPDTKKWWYETAEPGWVNNELQTYIAGRKGDIVTADVSDGTLKIHAIKDGDRVYSARVNTNEGWTYGYFEARLKLPKGKGTWPAFWMMPVTWSGWPEGGEIDIMEHVGCVPTEVSSSIHCKAYYHAINTQKTAAKKIATVMDEFHTYALEWTPEYIRTYVDGVQLFYYNPDDYPKGRNADTWPFNKPFQLKLNLAWGGDWGGMYGVDESCLPATFEIDYVRVFQKTE